MGIEGVENLTGDDGTKTHTPIIQDQEKYTGNEPNDRKLAPPVEQAPIAPLTPEYLQAQKDAEAKKESELDAARELHNRVTAGEDPSDVQASQQNSQ